MPTSYKVTVEIPITDVPDGISIQEAKVTSEIWLKVKIPDAKLIKFEIADANEAVGE